LTCEYIALECTNGCKKMIMISEFPNHLEIECDHRLVECELCETRVKKIEIEAHLATDCPKQMIQCENCHSQHSVLREKVLQI
jgi:phage FluMu protein Com